ncbi:MAG: glucose 1-dehydrogenase [Promethearchaeota archaeon]|nr:MAG: glucose 1-dehydrogenase [Candidatus Lokiarchaeota archaeon]
MLRLDSKVAIITGGSSGIGKATVKLFVKEGAKVIFGDILDERGEKLAAELGENVHFIHTNVRKEAEIKALIDSAINMFGQLDILFNNAGFGGVSGRIEETDTDAFDVTIETNFRSVVLGMKHAAPIMKIQGSGAIINTASVAGIGTGWGPHIYSALKAAIIQLTHTVAMELGEDNIRVNCVCPGGIATCIFGRGFGLDQDKAERLSMLLKIPFEDLQPIKRAGTPEDIAKAVLWLASDDASFVNGHALVVDGGGVLGRKFDETLEEFQELADLLKLGDIEDLQRKVNKQIASMK